MNTLSYLLATAGFLSVLGGWVWYLSTVPRMAVPKRPFGTAFFQALGLIFGTAALLNIQTGDTVATAVICVMAGMGIGFSIFFFWLLTQRKTPIGELQISVGDALLPFEAVTSEGVHFSSDEMAGQRVLLKFFRGGW